MPLTSLTTQVAATPAPAAWANLVKANFDVLIAAWTAYTPTLTGITIGNGTVTSAYIQVGKTVTFRATVTLGSTSTVGTSPSISAPVTVKASVSQAVAAWFYDTSADALYAGAANLQTNSTARVAAGSGNVTATVPFTWAVGDTVTITGTYEAA